MHAWTVRYSPLFDQLVLASQTALLADVVRLAELILEVAFVRATHLLVKDGYLFQLFKRILVLFELVRLFDRLAPEFHLVGFVPLGVLALFPRDNFTACVVLELALGFSTRCLLCGAVHDLRPRAANGWGRCHCFALVPLCKYFISVKCINVPS